MRRSTWTAALSLSLLVSPIALVAADEPEVAALRERMAALEAQNNGIRAAWYVVNRLRFGMPRPLRHLQLLMRGTRCE